jgi:hypothetical protein
VIISADDGIFKRAGAAALSPLRDAADCYPDQPLSGIDILGQDIENHRHRHCFTFSTRLLALAVAFLVISFSFSTSLSRIKILPLQITSETQLPEAQYTKSEAKL